MGTSSPPDDTVRNVRTRLLRHFDVHARDLPWRRTDDPYAVWVSEIMLQQTRVETVVPYYERWMERYPSVEALADADLDDVLKSWEGLGYYRRARFLHRAAGVVRDRLGGELPDTAAGLRELPGIGPYTAGAVASIAFGRREPAVDGNVRRVLARILDLPDPTPAELRDHAARLVDPERPGDFNQALMELGATVCTPRSPACGACPVADLCRARALGVQDDRPRPVARADVPRVEYAVAVVVRRPPGSEGGVSRLGGERTHRWEALLVRRPESGMLGGLWEFPSGTLSEGERPSEGAARAAADLGFSRVSDPSPMDPVPHTYSHLRAVYHPFLVQVAATGPEPPTSPTGSERVPGPDPAGQHRPRTWVDRAGLADLALPRAQRRIARALSDRLP